MWFVHVACGMELAYNQRGKTGKEKEKNRTPRALPAAPAEEGESLSKKIDQKKKKKEMRQKIKNETKLIRIRLLKCLSVTLLLLLYFFLT